MIIKNGNQVKNKNPMSVSTRATQKQLDLTVN